MPFGMTAPLTCRALGMRLKSLPQTTADGLRIAATYAPEYFSAKALYRGSQTHQRYDALEQFGNALATLPATRVNAEFRNGLPGASVFRNWFKIGSTIQFFQAPDGDGSELGPYQVFKMADRFSRPDEPVVARSVLHHLAQPLLEDGTMLTRGMLNPASFPIMDTGPRSTHSGVFAPAESVYHVAELVWALNTLPWSDTYDRSALSYGTLFGTVDASGSSRVADILRIFGAFAPIDTVHRSTAALLALPPQDQDWAMAQALRQANRWAPTFSAARYIDYLNIWAEVTSIILQTEPASDATARHLDQHSRAQLEAARATQWDSAHRNDMLGSHHNDITALAR